MKKFMKEITLFIIQLLIFYLFPLFAKQIDAIGMVLFLITATFVLSALMGIISTNKIKYFYPLITAILFIPSVFIYYNESALIHSVWYFVVFRCRNSDRNGHNQIICKIIMKPQHDRCK